MNRGLLILRFLLLASGSVLAVLGLLFWTGRSLNLVPVHMLLGVLLVLCLWILGGLGVREGISSGFLALVFSWSLILPLSGLSQNRLLPGAWHWTIQAAHLIVGGLAIGLGQVLVRRIAAMRQGEYR